MDENVSQCALLVGVMVVDFNKVVVLFSSFLVISPVNAQTEVQQEETIQYVKTNVAKATKELGDTINLCDKQKKVSAIPTLNNIHLKSINADKNQLIIGLSHLNFRNRQKCERSSRINLAYELATLNLVHEHYQLDTQSVKEIASGLIYPTIGELKLSASYTKLPDKLKQYLEKTIGDNQFDLFKALEINQLSPGK